MVPRLILSLSNDSRSLPLGSDAWGTTRVLLPAWAATTQFRHLLTGETVHVTTGHVPAAAVFRTCPVVLMWAEAQARQAEQDAA
jgi:maltooligosyltrehalose synthase